MSHICSILCVYVFCLKGFPALLKRSLSTNKFVINKSRKCGIIQEMWDSLQQNKENEFPVVYSAFLCQLLKHAHTHAFTFSVEKKIYLITRSYEVIILA